MSDAAPEKKKLRKLPKFVNLHIFLILMVVLFPLLILWKFYHLGRTVDKEELEAMEVPVTDDVLDMYFPLKAHTEDYVDDGITSIAFLGNNPFADDRDSSDNLVNMVKEQLGAEVYNFSLKDTYMACLLEEYNGTAFPLDAYSFYWLIELLTSGSNRDFYPAASQTLRELGEIVPENCDEVIEELLSVDFSKMDIAVIMYDASDYLFGMGMYNDGDHYDKTCFTGSLEAGIEKLQAKFPNTRLIVMSPTYAFYRLEDGRYVSSDKFRYTDRFGRDVLSTYSIKEFMYTTSHGVTFIDNLYGTITEDTAENYLTDHYHLNVEGRKLVAARLIEAIKHFDPAETDSGTD